MNLAPLRERLRRSKTFHAKAQKRIERRKAELRTEGIELTPANRMRIFLNVSAPDN
jgi:hypothetical protein